MSTPACTVVGTVLDPFRVTSGDVRLLPNAADTWWAYLLSDPPTPAPASHAPSPEPRDQVAAALARERSISPQAHAGIHGDTRSRPCSTHTRSTHAHDDHARSTTRAQHGPAGPPTTHGHRDSTAATCRTGVPLSPGLPRYRRYRWRWGCHGVPAAGGRAVLGLAAGGRPGGRGRVVDG